jgi:hypothetical protein
MFASCTLFASVGAASKLWDTSEERRQRLLVRRWVWELQNVFLGLNVLVSLIAIVVLIIYGFCVLPWYAVLICAVVAWLSSTALLGLIIGWLVPSLAAILLSYLLLGAVLVWYFFGRS